MKRWMIVLGLVVAGAVGVSFVPPCQRASWWATTVVASGQAPVTLEDISKYRIPYRRALFKALSVEAKRALWTEQFTHMLQSPSLTAEQVSVLQDSLAFVRTAYETPPDQAAYVRLVTRAAAAFPVAVQRQFVRLGPADNAPARRSPARPIGFGGVQQGGDCECNTEFGGLLIRDCDEGDPNFVGCAGYGCDSSGWGCGYAWANSCNGFCGYGVINGKP